MPHWTETFFAEYFKIFGFDNKDPDLNELEARFIARALDLKKGDRILDLCCGTGRHSIELAKRGYDVVGIDLTKYYIDCATEEASRKKIECEFLVGDMRAIPFENEFDAVFNFFTSWGYYSDMEDLQVLQQVHKALKPGGRFLLEVMNRDWIIAEFIPLDIQSEADMELIQYRRFLPETSCLEVEYIYLKNREVIRQDSVDLRIYSLHEIYNMFRIAGIKPIRNWGNALGEDFALSDSNRCVVLGEK